MLAQALHVIYMRISEGAWEASHQQRASH